MEKTVAPASHLTAAKVCHSLFYCQLMHNPFPARLIKEPQGQLQLPLLFRGISDNLPFSGKYSYIAQHLKKQKNFIDVSKNEEITDPNGRHKKERKQLKTGGEMPARGQQLLRMHCSLKEQLTNPEC